MTTSCRNPESPDLAGPILGIATAWQYWSEVAQPSVLAYLEISTPRTAFGACMALWHLFDWVKAERLAGQALILSSPNVSVLRDVITWGKHREVRRSKGEITEVTEDLEGMRLMMGSGFGPVVEHLAKFTVHFEDGTATSLHEIVVKAYLDWHSYFDGLNSLADQG